MMDVRGGPKIPLAGEKSSSRASVSKISAVILANCYGKKCSLPIYIVISCRSWGVGSIDHITTHEGYPASFVSVISIT